MFERTRWIYNEDVEWRVIFLAVFHHSCKMERTNFSFSLSHFQKIKMFVCRSQPLIFDLWWHGEMSHCVWNNPLQQDINATFILLDYNKNYPTATVSYLTFTVTHYWLQWQYGQRVIVYLLTTGQLEEYLCFMMYHHTLIETKLCLWTPHLHKCYEGVNINTLTSHW